MGAFVGEDERANLPVLAARLVVGLAQGLALYLLYRADEHKAWPATDGYVFAPLLFLALYVPFLFLVGIRRVRPLVLAIWIAAVAVIVAAAGWYGIWQLEWDGPRHIPSGKLFFFLFGALFIAQSLVAAGDADRRFMARYATDFDVAWKLGLQVVLSAAFVGVFWGVLELGMSLFDLIGLTGFRAFIQHEWFAVPVTTLAFSGAIHLTDVRAGLVRGMRTLALTLLSWLLPLMTGLAAAFLVGLLFTGLAPLWNTRYAAGELLTAAAVLIILINAAYQDGTAEHRPASVLRYAGSLAAILLVPLIAISAYALYLRVGQYGWSEERVDAAACILVAGFYAAGYAASALPIGEWMVRIAVWNFSAALLVLAVLIAVFSPIADPARLAVASQMARLESGAVSADHFDFGYLRWGGGRFGTDALKRLTHFTGRRAHYVRAIALTVLAEKLGADTPPPAQDIRTNFTVYPKGMSLPPGFLEQDWRHDADYGALPNCLTEGRVACDAFVFDLGRGQTDIVILGRDAKGNRTTTNGLFERDQSNHWHVVGIPEDRWTCSAILNALHAGDWSLAPPPPPKGREVVVLGRWLAVSPLQPNTPDCPN